MAALDKTSNQKHGPTAHDPFSEPQEHVPHETEGFQTGPQGSHRSHRAAHLGPLANMSAVEGGAPAPPDSGGGGSGACGAAALAATGCVVRATGRRGGQKSRAGRLEDGKLEARKKKKRVPKPEKKGPAWGARSILVCGAPPERQPSPSAFSRACLRGRLQKATEKTKTEAPSCET